MTDRGGGASLLPYMPAGVMGSHDDDDVCMCVPVLVCVHTYVSLHAHS